MNENTPNYYAIIPANVRYDKRLKANEKLLYGEISSLCNKEGKCWATNKYFAELYDVSIVSISTWINNLIKFGYLNSELIYNDGTKQILYRFLKLGFEPHKENLNSIKENFVTPTQENFKRGIKENFKDNNTSTNNTSINKNNKKENKKENVFSEFCLDEFNEKEKEAINKWLIYKKEKRQSYTKTGLISLKNKLLKEKNSGINIFEAIENSIANNISYVYAGIYVASSFNSKDKSLKDQVKENLLNPSKNNYSSTVFEECV